MVHNYNYSVGISLFSVCLYIVTAICCESCGFIIISCRSQIRTFFLEFTFAEIASSSTLKDVLSDMKEQIDVVENFKSEIIDLDNVINKVFPNNSKLGWE